MKKITIINGWSDLNTGDSAIIISMIEKIKKNTDNFSINIISELNENNEFFANSINYIKDSFKDININLIGSAFYKNYSKSKFKEIVSFVKNFLCLHLPNKLIKNKLMKNNYYSTLLESDAVMSKGGHFIHDRGGLKGVIHLFKCLYPMLICRKFNKEYYIIAQSIGPIKSKGIFSGISYGLISKVLNSASAISVREVVSYDTLKDYGFFKNINLTSDYAFLMSKADTLPKELQSITENGKFVVITARQHDFKEKAGEEEYIRTIINVAKHIKNTYNYNVVFFAHVKGPNPFEDDRKIVEKIKKLDVNNEFIYVTNQYSPQTISYFYSFSELMIGTRFHSVIFALTSYVPAIAISYSGYKANIMKQFDMDKFMIGINNVNSSNLNKLIEMSNELITEREKYVQLIKTKKEEVLENIDSDLAFKKMIERL